MKDAQVVVRPAQRAHQHSGWYDVVHDGQPVRADLPHDLLQPRRRQRLHLAARCAGPGAGPRGRPASVRRFLPRPAADCPVRIRAARGNSSKRRHQAEANGAPAAGPLASPGERRVQSRSEGLHGRRRMAMAAEVRRTERTLTHKANRAVPFQFLLSHAPPSCALSPPNRLRRPPSSLDTERMPRVRRFR